MDPTVNTEGIKARQPSSFQADCIGVARAWGEDVRRLTAMAEPGQIQALLVLQGRCSVLCRHGGIEMGAGEYLVRDGATPVEFLPDQACEALSVRVSREAMRKRLPNLKACVLRPLQSASSEQQLLCDVATSLILHGSDLQPTSVAATTDMAVTVLTQSIARFCKPSRVSGKRADFQRERVKQFCRAHLTSPYFSLADVSRELGVSPAHLHRLFDTEPLTLMAWIQQERLEVAKAAIEADPDASWTLATIAAMSGFKDSAHFSRLFKRRFGLTPSAYRKTLLQSGSGDARIKPA